MAVDLHLHSTFSDGTEVPESIVAMAEEQGLTAIALTDHDNLDGIERAAAACAASAETAIRAGSATVVPKPRAKANTSNQNTLPLRAKA